MCAKIQVARSCEKLLLELRAAVHRDLIAEDFLRRRERDRCRLDGSVVADMHAHLVELYLSERRGVEEHRLLRQLHDRMIARKEILVTLVLSHLLHIVDVAETAFAIHIGNMRSGRDAHTVRLLVRLEPKVKASHFRAPPSQKFLHFRRSRHPLFFQNDATAKKVFVRFSKIAHTQEEKFLRLGRCRVFVFPKPKVQGAKATGKRERLELHEMTFFRDARIFAAASEFLALRETPKCTCKPWICLYCIATVATTSSNKIVTCHYILLLRVSPC